MKFLRMLLSVLFNYEIILLVCSLIMLNKGHELVAIYFVILSTGERIAKAINKSDIIYKN